MNLLPNQRNVMTDLETMGNQPDAAIFAIGAVKFNRDRGIYSKFYSKVDLQSCLDVGMTVDAQTIYWWFQQSEAARAEFDKAAPSIMEVLEKFAKWIKIADTDVWGNGAAFDNVVLKNAYNFCDMLLPWNYWNDKCFRTVKSSFEEFEEPKPKIKHHALHDARAQALHLLEIDAHGQETVEG